MNLSRFFIDEAIKKHVSINKTASPDGLAFNITRISKLSDTSSATIWRQLKKETKLRAETWIKLMRCLGNFDVDINKCKITIQVSNTPENKDILRKIRYYDFKDDYGEK
jgi:hypothetical protein